ncbi:MAG: hypothetical protein AAF711_08560, partial [Planctomycetota bacterium]
MVIDEAADLVLRLFEREDRLGFVVGIRKEIVSKLVFRVNFQDTNAYISKTCEKYTLSADPWRRRVLPRKMLAHGPEPIVEDGACIVIRLLIVIPV